MTAVWAGRGGRTLSRLGRIAAVGVGVPVAGVFAAGALAPSAGADTLTDMTAGLGQAVDQAASAVGVEVPDVPVPPRLPDPVAVVGEVLPVNLLRRDGNATEGVTSVADTGGVSGTPGTWAGSTDGSGLGSLTGDSSTTASGTPATFAASDVVDAANTTRQNKIDTVNRVAADLLSGDTSTIAELTGVLNIPTATDVASAVGDVTHLAGNLVDGTALADVQTSWDNYLASESYTSWRDNTDNPFAVRSVSDYADAADPAVARAADGIQALIDSVSARPVETVAQILGEAGGPVALLTDPVGAVTRVVDKIAGPDFLEWFGSWVRDDAAPDVLRSILDAAPILGAPFAAAVPAGLVGLVGSLLTALPVALGAPLIGASAGSTLGLVVLSTLTFGAWLASAAAVLPLAGLIGIGAGLLVFAAGTLVSFGVGAGMSAGGGLLTALFLTTMITGGYMAATIAIPAVAFLALAPLAIGGGALGGATLGTLLGSIPALASVPLVTGAFALGGFSATALPALGAFLVVALLNFADRAGRWNQGPLGRVMDALGTGWQTSDLRHVLDDLDDIWNATDTGSRTAHLAGFLNSLASVADFLDGDALRRLILSGAVPGAIIGAVASVLAGAVTGTATGVGLYPLNLLFTGGLWAAVALPIVALAFLATIVPPLAIATAAWVVGSLAISAPLWIPLTVISTIASIITVFTVNPLFIGGGIALGAGLGAALGAALTALLSVTGIGLPAGIALVPLLTGAGMGLGGFLAGAIPGVVGTVALVGALLNLAVIGGALLLGVPIIGVPVFLAMLPLFTGGAALAMLPLLATLPVPFIVAAGLSVLEGGVVGLGTTAVTLPGLVTAGAVIGGLAAVLSSLRGSVDVEGNSIAVDAQIYNPRFQRDAERVRVPKIADAGYGTGATDRTDRSLVDVKDLIFA